MDLRLKRMGINMKIINNLEQGTPEWKEFRNTRIGASDIPSICGVSPYQTVLQLWNQKLDGSETKENSAMEKGKQFEREVRELLNYHLPEGSKYVPVVCQHDSNEWAIASLDGYDGKRAIEIKFCGREIFDMIGEGAGIPIHFQYQCQWQMYVTGLEQITLIYGTSLDTGKCKDFVVVRDEALICEIVNEASNFYDMMLSFTPPEPTEKDIINRMDETWVKMSERMLAALEVLADAQAEVDACKQEMIFIAEGKNSQGGGIKVSFRNRQGMIDYKAIPAVKEMSTSQLERFRKKSITYWEVKANG
jgi:putative phage-type endonuclease